MDIKDLLFKFESKYQFLYDINVNGVPVYTCIRERVAKFLNNEVCSETDNVTETKGKIYAKRLLNSLVKLWQFRYAENLIFTSSMFRRDKGRNLAVEFLLDKYPCSVAFEWPSRIETYDSAYFRDKNIERYCPLDFCIVLNKIYSKLHKTEFQRTVNAVRMDLKNIFLKLEPTDEEKSAVEFIIQELPISFAEIQMSQRVFKSIFKQYKHVVSAIDFWGGARENIIPVLQGNPRSVELQHGIINSRHTGYIYPDFIKELSNPFFERQLLVYGQATKNLLVNESVFSENNIDVIGNPRVFKYKKEFKILDNKNKYILFTSQPFEQDGAADNYYNSVIPFLKEIQIVLKSDDRLKNYSLAIKLHPRENNGIMELYKKQLPDCIIFDNSSELYELLNQSFLHITVTSTTLYEAALFGVPSLLIPFNNFISSQTYGFTVYSFDKIEECDTLIPKLLNKQEYKRYLEYLQNKTEEYM